MAQFLWYDCTFKKQCTVPVTLTFDLWMSIIFQCIEYNPISILYKFQNDISSNSWEIKYQNIGRTHTQTHTHTHTQTDRQTDRVKTIPRNPLRGRGNNNIDTKSCCIFGMDSLKWMTHYLQNIWINIITSYVKNNLCSILKDNFTRLDMETFLNINLFTLLHLSNEIYLNRWKLIGKMSYKASQNCAPIGYLKMILVLTVISNITWVKENVPYSTILIWNSTTTYWDGPLCKYPCRWAHMYYMQGH